MSLTNNVFYDGKRVYDTERLWSLVSRRTPTRRKIKPLEWHLKEKVWSMRPMDVIRNRKKHSRHWSRIKNADLSYPILVNDEGIIIDGCHRLSKAYMMGRATILVHEVSEKDLRKARLNS